MRLTPIQKAVKKVGGVSELASRLGVTYQAVQQWVEAGRVPAERALAVEAATAGEITRHKLRPDIYPEEARAA